jgi:hypothetical protein
MSKSLPELKTLFRQSFPVKEGGPVDKARSRGAIASLDAVAEAATSGTQQITVESITNATEAGRRMLLAADAQAQLQLLDKFVIEATAGHPAFTQAYGSGGAIAWLLSVVGNLMGTPSQPDAPTDGRVDDKADTFSGTVHQANPALGDFELFYPGSGGNVPATNGRADLVGTTLTIRGLVGPFLPGTVGMRRAANGNIPASDWLTNADAFTGVAVSSKGYQPLYTDTYPDAV